MMSPSRGCAPSPGEGQPCQSSCQLGLRCGEEGRCEPLPAVVLMGVIVVIAAAVGLRHTERQILKSEVAKLAKQGAALLQAQLTDIPGSLASGQASPEDAETLQAVTSALGIVRLELLGSASDGVDWSPSESSAQLQTVTDGAFGPAVQLVGVTHAMLAEPSASGTATTVRLHVDMTRRGATLQQLSHLALGGLTTLLVLGSALTIILAHRQSASAAEPQL